MHGLAALVPVRCLLRRQQIAHSHNGAILALRCAGLLFEWLGLLSLSLCRTEGIGTITGVDLRAVCLSW